MNGMPDPLQRSAPYTNQVTGQPSSVPGTPGFSGAIQDLLAALAKSFAPRQITNRAGAVNTAVDQNSGGAPPTLGSQIGQ